MNDALLKKSSTQAVIDAIEELHAQEQLATRDTIAEVTGLKKTTVDDRLKVLVNDEKIHRVRDGLFVPVKQFPPSRPISKTILPNGMVKIEIGDEVLTLTPREDRMLSALGAAAALQFSQIEMGHQSAVLAAELAERVRKLERQITGMRAKTHDAQMTLIGEESVTLLGGIST